MNEINWNLDSTFNIEGTLIAVTDDQLWLSAEATNGGVTDSIVIEWSAGNRAKSLDALKSGMGIVIGSRIRVHGERNYMPRANRRIDWRVTAKLS